jgi:hypothetical protein
MVPRRGEGRGRRNELGEFVSEADAEVNNPTPEEIKAAAAEIRAENDKREREQLQLSQAVRMKHRRANEIAQNRKHTDRIRRLVRERVKRSDDDD